MSQPLRGTVSPIATHAIPVFHYSVILLLQNTNRWLMTAKRAREIEREREMSNALLLSGNINFS